jgi:hypothetical protein
VNRDDAGHSYRYALVDGSLPVSDYRATLAVRQGEGGSARVIWSSEFTPAGVTDKEAAEPIREFLSGGLANLKRLFDGEGA